MDHRVETQAGLFLKRAALSLHGQIDSARKVFVWIGRDRKELSRIATPRKHQGTGSKLQLTNNDGAILDRAFHLQLNPKVKII
jgi:hypothetical protein